MNTDKLLKWIIIIPIAAPTKGITVSKVIRTNPNQKQQGGTFYYTVLHNYIKNNKILSNNDSVTVRLFIVGINISYKVVDTTPNSS